MPRVSLSAEQKKAYKLKDFKKWVRMQMAANRITQTTVGQALGISQETLSQRLKDKKIGGKIVNKDPFSYGDVLILCNLFGVDKDEREKLLTL